MKKILTLLLACLLSNSAFADSPYDSLNQIFQPFMRPKDPLTWPFKVRSITLGEYNYWRGTKPMYYAWAKTHAADWLADKDSYTLCHGDLHIGNTGTYVIDPNGKVAFGMVDFDESAVFPFQLELLGASISLQLSKLQAGLPLLPAASAKDLRNLLDSYREALQSSHDATELLAGDNVVQLMMAPEEQAYKKEVKKLAPTGKFPSSIWDKEGRCKDILRPAGDRKDEFARGLAETLARSPKTRELFRISSYEDLRASIRDIALRTRIDSAGSQGFDKFFVLMDHPLNGIPGDAVLYMKREVGSAAELAQMIPADSRPGGQRASEAMAKLTSPPPYLNDWVQVGNESFWLTIREPWSEDMEPGSESTANLARVLGTAAGSAHRRNTNPAQILARLTPALEEQLRQRTDAYVALVQSDFPQLNADPRVHELLLQTQQTLSALAKN